jgi:hypothetical protein
MRTALLLFVTCIPMFAVAQNQAPAARPGAQSGTLTRSASKYKGLELQLLQAQKDKDQASISSLLAEDFEAWIAGAGSPIPRAEWNRRWKKTHPGDYQLRDFSTREFGDVAVIGFVLQPSSAAFPTIFVVDVWRQASGLLAVRYEAETKVKAEPGPPAHKG